MVCETLHERYPAVRRMLIEAEDEILAFYAFPAAHLAATWASIRRVREAT